MAKGKLKEVATRKSPIGSTTDTFGGNPGKVEVTGGTMHTFGHKIHNGVWPTNITSPNAKTGFPKNFDQGKKGPRP